jgi:O-antigen/teichoic acid export membrane protein
MIRRNVIANSASKLWAAALSLAVVPFYLHILGIEAFGLIGVFLTLGPILSLLDLGLGTTLNRRLAQLSVLANRAGEMRDLLRTLEVIYWLVGLAIGVVLIALAPLIASHWIRPQQLATESVALALALMGIALACQWPLALYSGGLMGIERQVLASMVSACVITVRSIGAVLVLWLVAPTLQAFFAWQIGVSLAETVVNMVLLWRLLPAADRRPAFRVSALKEIWRFAAGVTGISAMAVILTQLDKVILSKVLTLDAFGYYSLACRVAVGLYYLAGPINTAFFPRFSQLAAQGDNKELARLYHGSCQLLSVAVIPVTIVLAFFPAEFLVLWTANWNVANSTSPLLRLILVGTALNALMTLPLALQLANGWTRLVFAVNTAAVIVLGPMIYVMALYHGAVGAAWVWIVLNCGYVLILLPMMHRRILPAELRAWFIVDVGIPLAAGLIVASIWKALIAGATSYAGMAVYMMLVSIFTLSATALAAPRIRAVIVRFMCTSAERPSGP